jgi:hypothetical protein
MEQDWTLCLDLAPTPKKTLALELYWTPCLDWAWSWRFRTVDRLRRFQTVDHR